VAKRIRIAQTEDGTVLTISEVAEILRMHPTTIYRLVKRGQIQGFKIGGNWRINGGSLDLWLSGAHPQRLSSRA
jgi:excisionase family DNA binding protein